MKLAPISIILLLLCALLFSCRNNKVDSGESEPQKEAPAQSPKKMKGEDDHSLEQEIPNKKQRPERAVKKKKSALDTLRPRTA